MYSSSGTGEVVMYSSNFVDAGSWITVPERLFWVDLD